MFKQNKAVTVLILGIILISLFVIKTQESEASRPTLHFGSEGQYVMEVQQKLKELGYYKGEVNGVYDGETLRTVKQFQEDKGITASGLVRRETWEALGFEMATDRVDRNDLLSRENDVEILARLVHAEARGEPYLGQVAVAAVVLNRIESPAFPNSMSGVIFQPLQFESVGNGQFDLDPNEQNLRAARSALNGWDPTQGSLYFWNPNKPVNPWILTRRIVREIQNHVFAT